MMICEYKRKGRDMSTFWLKIIAITTMVIDHTGAVFFPEYPVLRMIGRLAFPIFAFLIAEGAYHTKDLKKYMWRMLGFALLTEIPFDFAFERQWLNWGHQNVMWTFFLALAAIYFDQKYARPKGKPAIFVVAAMATALIAAYTKTDYGAIGVLLVLVFYHFRQQPVLKFSCAGLLMASFGLEYTFLRMQFLHSYYMEMGKEQQFWQNWQRCLVISDHIQFLACLSFPLIGWYNGQKGRSLQYFFYAFYPGHLLIIGMIANFIK